MFVEAINNDNTRYFNVNADRTIIIKRYVSGAIYNFSSYLMLYIIAIKHRNIAKNSTNNLNNLSIIYLNHNDLFNYRQAFLNTG